MNTNEQYFMIKIKNVDSKYRTWVGWSNSNSSLGFYITTENQCKIFSKTILEESKDIEKFLQNKQYDLIPVINVEEIKQSRLYY
jgi:hypothetical protein